MPQGIRAKDRSQRISPEKTDARDTAILRGNGLFFHRARLLQRLRRLVDEPYSIFAGRAVEPYARRRRLRRRNDVGRCFSGTKRCFAK